jgi:hypothetical protein
VAWAPALSSLAAERHAASANVASASANSQVFEQRLDVGEPGARRRIVREVGARQEGLEVTVAELARVLAEDLTAPT